MPSTMTSQSNRPDKIIRLTHVTQMTLRGLREYAQAEGVLVELGVASELTLDLSWKNGVSETTKFCKKDPCNSTRPYIDFVLGGSVTDTCLTRVSRYMPREFSFHSLLWFISPHF
jgi:hypothetical protein